MVLPERFLNKFKVDETSGCWLWFGSRNRKNYGVIKLERQRRNAMAHRFCYEALVGPIPEGMQLDHLCRTPNCVNPNHLEVVSNRENVLRGSTIPAAYAKRTSCKNGHPFIGDNFYIKNNARICRLCTRVGV